MAFYNTTSAGRTSWKEFTQEPGGKPNLFDWLRSLPALVLIFLLGLASLIPSRKKIEEKLLPMGCKPVVIPPGYRYQSVTPIQPKDISKKVRAYSIGQPAKDIHEFHSNLYIQLNESWKENHLSI